MKKVVVFMGSARKGKNTDFVVDKLIEGIISPEISAEKICLVDYHINYCRGCYGCSKTGKCVLKDDMESIYAKIEEADGFVFASPSYNYNVTANMKALLDRFNCYFDYNDSGWTSRLERNKMGIVVGLCGGPDEQSMGFTVTGMVKPLKDLGIELFRQLLYFNTVKYPVKLNESFQNELIELGRAFNIALTQTT